MGTIYELHFLSDIMIEYFGNEVKERKTDD